MKNKLYEIFNDTQPSREMINYFIQGIVLKLANKKGTIKCISRS